MRRPLISPILTFLQSCAATLAKHPDKFKVTIVERMAVTGGQATSISLDKEKYGTDWMNDGVQGGSQVSLLRVFNTKLQILTYPRYSNTHSISSRNMVTSHRKSSFK